MARTKQSKKTTRSKKRVNTRSKRRYPGLEKGMNLKIRWDLLENDYLDQLNDDDKKWLNDFNEEYVGANFNHSGKTLHKSKKKQRDCYNRNNARNRCVYGLAKAKGEVFDTPNTNENVSIDIEDSLIDYIDSKKKLKQV